MDSKTKLLFAVTLALFLLTGILGGIVIERKVLFPMYNNSGQQASAGQQGDAQQQGDQLPPPPPGHEKQPGAMKVFLGRLTHELSLDEEQQQKVLAILQENEKDFESLRREIKEKFDDLDLELAEKIGEVLSDEQKEKMSSSFIKWQQPQPQPPHTAAPGTPPPPAGAHPTPPKEALDVCRGKAEGSPCSFQAPHGTVSGTCGRTPRNEMTCKP